MAKRSDQDKEAKRASKLRLHAFNNRVTLTAIGKELGITTTAVYHRFGRAAGLDEVEKVIETIIESRRTQMKEAV